MSFIISSIGAVSKTADEVRQKENKPLLFWKSYERRELGGKLLLRGKWLVMFPGSGL